MYFNRQGQGKLHIAYACYSRERSPASPPMARLLDNRYNILQNLAEGGFGTTFLAADTRTPSQRPCVVKQLKPSGPDMQALITQRFTREAAVLETLGLQNRQIPLLYAYFQENNDYYLVQEYIQGETLTQSVQRQGPWPETAVQTLLLQLLPVLASIQSHSIIHRDIKPDNIIIRQSDRLPVLIDFGAVKEAIVPNPSDASIVIGTPGFMAPEQAVGRPVYSSDLYALGLTAIYCLTGQQPTAFVNNPQTGEIDWRSPQPLTPAFKRLLNQAIAPNAHARFPTAQAMLQALETLGPTSDLESPPTQVAPQHPKTIAVAAQPQPKRPNRWPLFIGIFLAMLAVGGTTWGLLSRSRPPMLETATAPELTVEMARSTITAFYQNLSSQSWDQAKALAGDRLKANFDPQFFRQFSQISVENLQVLSQTGDRIELQGENLYRYADGTSQREARTFEIILVEGQPQIADSKFLRVIQARR
jgi:serine/threonine protein kinase, bacterial